VLKWIFTNAHAVLAMGEPGIRARRLLGCPDHKLRNLPIPVDLDVAQQIDPAFREQADAMRRSYAPAGETIFLCAGRLSPEKGYEVAFQAFARVLSQSTPKRPVLLLAGDGPMRRELQEVVAGLGLTEQVKFLGWCQHEQMKLLFYLSDVLVHPSIWDKFPVAILEAMAWGLPVLASDQTMSAVDRVRPGESGFIHRVGDSAALADHILYFLNDPAQIAIMGARARQTAEQWPVSRCVQTILNLA
jgi:glycosyltransferase involved in cell wall biosynthesis